MPARVKICCISSIDEARMAIAHGADAIGLVSAMPSGPGVVDEAVIAEIISLVPPPIATFLLTSETDADSIIDQAKRCRPTTLQLVDALPEPELLKLRIALPATKLVQVIHVVGERSIDEAVEASKMVDVILLDSGNPAVRELGGTGRVHDWSLSKRIVDAVDVPVFLAGGLTPTNVAEAIAVVRPFGVDICSGVRTDGRLDEDKLRAFVAAV